MTVKASLVAAFTFALGTLTATIAFADNFPSKPITIIVPFAPGGATDVLPRLFSERLQAELGQPIVIENVSGAGGTIGLTRAAHATPDGYTIVSGNWSTFVSNGAIYKASYDVVKDFDPVILLPANSHLLAARQSMPANNLMEFVDWLKANQDKASVATAGIGTGGHLGAVLLQHLTHTEFPLVHYRGGGPALQDLLAGHVDATTNQAAVFLPHMKAGTLKIYAVLAQHRLPEAPNIPTAAEAGLPGFEVSIWNGFWAPKGTPKDAVLKINAAVRKIMSDPDMTQKLENLTYEIPPAEQQTPEALGKLQLAEIDKWWPIIKAANITNN